MATVTNISGTPRALPLKDGTYIEFAKGEAKDFPDADWAAISGRDDVKASFTAEGVAEPVAPKGKTSKKDAE